MDLKTIDKDLTAGYKPLYKKIIKAAVTGTANSYYPELWPVTANAYCDEKDKFDEKIGVEVCAAKLEWKNHTKLAKAYERAHKALVEAAIIVGALHKKHAEKAHAIEDDLVRTYGRLKV